MSWTNTWMDLNFERAKCEGNFRRGLTAVRVRLRLGFHTTDAHHFGVAAADGGERGDRPPEWAGYPGRANQSVPLAGPVDQMNRR